MPGSGKAGFLLDTNVISEATRPKPDPGVMTWLAAVDEDTVFLSVATLAEISRGLEAMPAGRKRERLRDWFLNDLIPRFEGRLLPVDTPTSLLWGSVVAQSKKAGHEMEAIDALIAATAARHDLTLVTRNVAHFTSAGLLLLNPWTASGG